MNRDRLLDRESSNPNTKRSEEQLKAFSIRKKEKKNKKAARVTKKRDIADNEVSDSSSSSSEEGGNVTYVPESYYKSNMNMDQKDSTAASMMQETCNFGENRKDPYDIEIYEDSEGSDNSFHNKNRHSYWMKEVIGNSSLSSKGSFHPTIAAFLS